jgi:hypothetical protein
MGQGTLSFSKKPRPVFNVLTGGHIMKIKSLLLGSAAASMLAATGAQAADPIVYVEPEPMEYVRICDVYGAGFFYIPGTETCLQIGGYVRYEIRFGDQRSTEEDDDFIFDPWDDTYRKHLEARVNFDARSETEWGTLRAYIRIQASDYNDERIEGASPGAPNMNRNGGIGAGGDFDARFDQAFIQLGGLTMGYTESYFVDGKGGIGNYGTHGMNGGFDAGGPHSGSGQYGYQQRMLIAYNFATNGFFGSVSLEDDGNAAGDNNYMPDVVGRLGFTQAWGGIYGVIGYDESAEEFAGRLGGELNVGTAGSLRLFAMYSSGSNAYWSQSDWSVTGSYQHTFNPAFFAHVGATYWGGDAGGIAGNDGYGIEAGIGWNVATGFQVRAEGQYTSFDAPQLTDSTNAARGDAYSGRIRFIRTF